MNKSDGRIGYRARTYTYIGSVNCRRSGRGGRWRPPLPSAPDRLPSPIEHGRQWIEIGPQRFVAVSLSTGSVPMPVQVSRGNYLRDHALTGEPQH